VYSSAPSCAAIAALWYVLRPLVVVSFARRCRHDRQKGPRHGLDNDRRLHLPECTYPSEHQERGGESRALGRHSVAPVVLPLYFSSLVSRTRMSRSSCTCSRLCEPGQLRSAVHVTLFLHDSLFSILFRRSREIETLITLESISRVPDPGTRRDRLQQRATWPH
jgi:hypothetical protein